MKKFINFIVTMMLLVAWSSAATTTLSTGGGDSWNDGTWSSGVPSGSIDAEIAAGVQADVNDGSTPVYTGNLLLRDGSKLTIANNATDMNALGGVNIFMHNATLDIDRNVNFSLPDIHVIGNGIMELRDLANGNLPRLSGNISGTGNLYFPGVFNNEVVVFETSNDISGGMIFTTSGRGAVAFETPLAGGRGDVTMLTTDPNNRHIYVLIESDDVFDDNATLSIDGTEGKNGGIGTGYGTVAGTFLIRMKNYEDTIGQLKINGNYYGAGNYSASAGAGVDYVMNWMDGTGILTVQGGPADASAPTVDFTAVDHDGGAGPVYPDETITYTLTFDEPVYPTPSTSDLENADATTISVESVTRVDDLTYTVKVKALEAGTVTLRFTAAASISDFFGNSLVTPVADDQTFTVSPNPLVEGQLGLWKPWANSGINPATGVAWKKGDEYRLAFITSSSSTRDATSTDINDYNDFVQTSANTGTASANLATVSWTAIGSTSTVDAKTNTGTDEGAETGVPVLLLDGFTVMATNNADIWDGSNTFSSPIYTTVTQITPFIDEDGGFRATTVHTGTDSDGTANATQPLGTTASKNRVGDGNRTVVGQWLNAYDRTKTSNYSFYGISEVLRLQSTIPPTGTLIRIE